MQVQRPRGRNALENLKNNKRISEAGMDRGTGTVIKGRPLSLLAMVKNWHFTEVRRYWRVTSVAALWGTQAVGHEGKNWKPNRLLKEAEDGLMPAWPGVGSD